MWVSLLRSVKGLNRQKADHSLARENAVSWWTTTLALPWVSGLLAYAEDFGLASLHNCTSQFPKFSPPKPSLFLVLFLWRTLTNTNIISIYYSINLLDNSETELHGVFWQRVNIVLPVEKNQTGSMFFWSQSCGYKTESFCGDGRFTKDRGDRIPENEETGLLLTEHA